MARSRRIPIDRPTQLGYEQAERHQQSVIADYKDFVFYSRLVDGMRKKQDATQDIRLRYQNQALIDHIVYTRNTRETTCDPPQTIPPPPTSIYRNKFKQERGEDNDAPAAIMSAVSAVMSLINEKEDERDEEDELIFEMDL